MNRWSTLSFIFVVVNVDIILCAIHSYHERRTMHSPLILMAVMQCAYLLPVSIRVCVHRSIFAGLLVLHSTIDNYFTWNPSINSLTYELFCSHRHIIDLTTLLCFILKFVSFPSLNIVCWCFDMRFLFLSPFFSTFICKSILYRILMHRSAVNTVQRAHTIRFDAVFFCFHLTWLCDTIRLF